MNYEVFLDDITRKVLTSVSLQQLNSDLKESIYTSCTTNPAVEKINSVVAKVAGEKLKELKSEQVKKIATGFRNNRENFVNTMHATLDEPGFIYTISTIELAICDYVIKYENSLNKPEKKVDEKTEEKVDENIFSK